MKKLSFRNSVFHKKKAPKGATPNDQIKLLQAIIEANGGLIETAKKLKVSKQVVYAWRHYGAVPLTRIMEVAEGLGLNPLALNYNRYSKLIGSKATWEEVKSECLQQLSDC